MKEVENTFEGIWNLHFEDGSAAAFSGTLDISEYLLTIYRDDENHDREIGNLNNGKKFYITGRSTNSFDITLYGCFFILSTVSSTFIEHAEIRYSQALFGSLLNNSNEQKFESITFSFSCFDSMMIPNEGMEESIDRYGLCKFYKDEKSNKILCKIEFKNGLFLQDALDIMHEFRCFFVLLYCARINIIYSSLSIKSCHGKSSSVIIIQSTYSEKKPPKYAYEVLPRVGECLFARWETFYVKYREQIKPIFEILTHSDTASERPLVTCAHAIEGFFSIVSRSSKEFTYYKYDKGEFKEIVKEIEQFLKSNNTNSNIISSIKTSLPYANNISLRDRLEQLMNFYLDDALCSYFLVIPKGKNDTSNSEYAGTISAIRNYFAHLDPSGAKKKVTDITDDYIELYNYKVSIFAFLYILLAKEFFKDNKHVLYRLTNNISFPYTEEFYAKRVKPEPSPH